MKTFEDLEVWRKAREFRIEIVTIVKLFPKEEDYLLKSQIIRSSRSIGANIAEGYGRYNFQGNIRFCRIARGSLYESLDHLIVAFDEGYIINEVLQNFRMNIEHLMKLLNGYISYLKKKLIN